MVKEELLNEDKAIDEFRHGIALALRNLTKIKLTASNVKKVQHLLISAIDITEGLN